MQVIYFLNGPIFIYLFIYLFIHLFIYFVILIYNDRKGLLMRNLGAILLLKSKLSEKFQRFNGIYRSIEMLKNSWIFKNFILKWKIVKYFARPKQRSALRKLFPLQPRKKLVKALLHLWNKSSFKGVFRNIQAFAFKMLQECRSWASRNVLQCKYFLCHQK